MIKLTELNPRFVRYSVGVADKSHGMTLPNGTIQWGGFPAQQIDNCDSFAEAQGIWFLCPICFKKNGGSVGTHAVEVTFAGRGAEPDQGSHDSAGNPSRWNASGTGFEDLVLSPSILLTGGGCGWHGFVGMQGAPPGWVNVV